MDEQKHESVTHWLHQLSTDDDTTAQQQLWGRYFARLAALARTRLSGAPQRDADEEDVVLSAFNSFFSGARAGRFPELHDRMGLWPLLVTITARKAINQIRRQQAKKRSNASEEAVPEIEQLVGNEPTPQFALEIAEQAERLLAQLDEELQTVARMKLEGFTNAEIADRLGVVVRSVERKLARIRLEWNDSVNPMGGEC
jgi:RNA polymerase sigma factor (sigma-70 family)